MSKKLTKSYFNTLNVVTCAMLCALAVILGATLHNLFGREISTLFSPMHLPVFLAGILCGEWLGLICGVIAPIASFASSGRPIFPQGLVPMLFELATYGFLSGLLRRVFLHNPKTNKLSSVLALVVAMVAGRLANALVGAVVMLLTTNDVPFFMSFGTTLMGNFAKTWAGIIIHLALVPTVLFAMQRSGVLLKYVGQSAQQASGNDIADGSANQPPNSKNANVENNDEQTEE